MLGSSAYRVIPGAFNTWADLLTLWAAPGNEESPAGRLSALRVPLIIADLPELPVVVWNCARCMGCWPFFSRLFGHTGVIHNTLAFGRV